MPPCVSCGSDIILNTSRFSCLATRHKAFEWPCCLCPVSFVSCLADGESQRTWMKMDVNRLHTLLQFSGTPVFLFISLAISSSWYYTKYISTWVLRVFALSSFIRLQCGFCVLWWWHTMWHSDTMGVFSGSAGAPAGVLTTIPSPSALRPSLIFSCSLFINSGLSFCECRD